ncbi:MAG: hypothetical protein WD045_14135 [Pirellulaceae bacterium]
MAKYYVQSGTVNLVVDAADEQRAALWSVHRTMEPVMPSEDQCAQDDDVNWHEVEAVGGMVLGDTIRLSERGFNAEDATELDTWQVVAEWSQLMNALSRMQRDMEAA